MASVGDRLPGSPRNHPASRRSPRWLMPVVVALLIFGIGLRFTHLDQKVYWYDEVSTSLSVSGNSEQDIVDDFAEINEPVSPEFLQTYQRFKPDSTSIDTIQRLVNENPHHPPLYYLLGRQWARVFGLTPGTLRGLAATISLFSLPCAYWLCQELFAKPAVGWVAVALMTISPLHLAYAQEARQYSLWMVLVLASSAAFLWAMRSRSKWSWAVYSALLIAGFYTQLFFGLVALSHGLHGLSQWNGWVALHSPNKTEETRPLGQSLPAPLPAIRSEAQAQNEERPEPWGYVVASAIALFAFSPWLWVILREFQNADRLTTWTREYPLTRLGLSKVWLHNLSLSFFDTGIEQFSDRLIPAYLTFALLLAYGLYYLCRRGPTPSALFLLTLMGCTALPLFLPDLILGGRRTIMARYLLPFYLAAQIVVAYLLGSKLTQASPQSKGRAWTLVTGVLLGASLLSCGVYSQSALWWTKGFNLDNLAVAEIINRSDRPLIINNGPVPFAISQSYYFQPNAGILLEPYCTNCKQTTPGQGELNIPELPDETADQFSHRFLLNSYSSQSWKASLEERPEAIEQRYQGRVSQLLELLPEEN